MSSKAVTRMSELINAGRWKQAVLIAEHAEKDPSFQPDAHFYIQWALVKRLLGQDTETQLERARASSGYNELMAGDIIRDAALGLLREGNPDEAERTLAGAYEYHQGNTNRMAALLMTEARIHFARSQYALARSAHERAYRMWRTAPDADRQWVMNNNFHWLKANAALGHRDFGLVREIHYTDPRLDRKVFSWLMFFLGRVGVKLMALVETRKGK